MPAVDAESGKIATPSVRSFADVRKGFTAFREGDVLFAKITPCMENGKAAIRTGSIQRPGVRFNRIPRAEAPRRHGRVRVVFHTSGIVPSSGGGPDDGFRRTAACSSRLPEIRQHTIGSLAEQRRLVAQINDLMAHADAARERLARAKSLLKRFRRSVLAAACDGRLTEDWRKDGPPSVDAIPPGGHLSSLGKEASFVTSGSRGWAKYYSEAGAAFIRSQDINTDRLAIDQAAHVRLPRGIEGSRTRVKPNDLLITITGANVTKCARVDCDPGEACVSQHVALIRPRLEAMAPYLWLCCVSPTHGRRQLVEAAYGAGKPGLNLDNVRSVEILVPPPEERREIVRRAERLFGLADSVEGKLAAASAHVARLAEAALAEAFRGELVPTEAELARQEGRGYESAAELLKRTHRDDVVTARVART